MKEPRRKCPVKPPADDAVLKQAYGPRWAGPHPPDCAGGCGGTGWIERLPSSRSRAELARELRELSGHESWANPDCLAPHGAEGLLLEAAALLEDDTHGRQLADPKTGHWKTYRAQLARHLGEHIKALDEQSHDPETRLAWVRGAGTCSLMREALDLILEDDSLERDAKRYQILRKAIPVSLATAHPPEWWAITEGPRLQYWIGIEAPPGYHESLDAAIDAWIEREGE